MERSIRVVVTGANRGIGLAIVKEILREKPGSFVFLGSRSLERGYEALEEVLAEVESAEGRVEVLGIDVGDSASVKAASRLVAERFPDEAQPLYGLVNNAGIGLGSADMEKVLNVNTYGPWRVFEAFLPLLEKKGGRVVNMSSGSAPNFMERCSDEVKRLLIAPDVTWEEITGLMDKAILITKGDEDFGVVGLGDGDAYGFSKACLNALTIELARANPDLIINACTPGFIETDLTRPLAEYRGLRPEEMGMKTPREGTRSTLFLLFGEPGGSGWYFGSDAKRSPMDRYRAPGDPPYQGD